MKQKYILISTILSIFLLIGSIALNSTPNFNILQIQANTDSKMPLNVSAYIILNKNGLKICGEANQQLFPKICSDMVGGAIIAWQDGRGGPSYAIYAQRINGSGQIYWTTDGVTIFNLDYNANIEQIISDGAGGAIILWRDSRSGFQTPYVQRINSTGHAQWQANGTAAAPETISRYDYAICTDGSGGVYVTWRDNRNSNYDVFVQRINSTGGLVWPTETVASIHNDSEYSPQICFDGVNSAIVAWRRQATDFDIYAQRINSTGDIQWAQNGSAVCAVVGNVGNPRISSDGAGGALITWQDTRTGAYDIYVQRLNSAGTELWGSNGMGVCIGLGNQYYPKVIHDGFNGAIIAWRDFRSGTSNDVYAQRINSAGTVLWTSNGTAICNSSKYEENFDLCSDNGGGAFVVWTQTENIFAQWIKSDGSINWTRSGAPVCTAGGDQKTPVICSNITGGAYIAWHDERTGNANDDIYVQGIVNGTYRPSGGGGLDLSFLLLLELDKPTNMTLPIVVMVIFIIGGFVLLVILKKQEVK